MSKVIKSTKTPTGKPKPAAKTQSKPVKKDVVVEAPHEPVVEPVVTATTQSEPVEQTEPQLADLGILTHEHVDDAIYSLVDLDEFDELLEQDELEDYSNLVPDSMEFAPVEEEVLEEDTFYYRNTLPYHHYVNDLGLYFAPRTSLDLGGEIRQKLNSSQNLKDSIKNGILQKITEEEYLKGKKLKAQLGREF